MAQRGVNDMGMKEEDESFEVEYDKEPEKASCDSYYEIMKKKIKYMEKKLESRKGILIEHDLKVLEDASR